MTLIPNEKLEILGVKIDAIDLDIAFERIAQWIKDRRRSIVCVVAVSTLVECRENPSYKNLINSADMATPDGMPLVWLGKLKGNKTIQRTYGPDLMNKVCGDGQRQGFRHYFYGGMPAV